MKVRMNLVIKNTLSGVLQFVGQYPGITEPVEQAQSTKVEFNIAEHPAAQAEKNVWDVASSQTGL